MTAQESDKMEKDKIIMFDSDDAAKIQTITGWVSNKGYWYGKDENSARYDGCTHRPCKICGEPTEKAYVSCYKCRCKNDHERYNNMPFKEWDGKTPLVVYNTDIYLWDDERVEDYILETLENNPDYPIELCICEPNYITEIDFQDMFTDILPEDGEIGDIDNEIIEIMDKLNEVINRKKPIASWSQGKFRTSYVLKEKSDDK